VLVQVWNVCHFWIQREGQSGPEPVQDIFQPMLRACESVPALLSACKPSLDKLALVHLQQLPKRAPDDREERRSLVNFLFTPAGVDDGIGGCDIALLVHHVHLWAEHATDEAIEGFLRDEILSYRRVKELSDGQTLSTGSPLALLTDASFFEVDAFALRFLKVWETCLLDELLGDQLSEASESIVGMDTPTMMALALEILSERQTPSKENGTVVRNSVKLLRQWNPLVCKIDAFQRALHLLKLINSLPLTYLRAGNQHHRFLLSVILEHSLIQVFSKARKPKIGESLMTVVIALRSSARLALEADPMGVGALLNSGAPLMRWALQLRIGRLPIDSSGSHMPSLLIALDDEALLMVERVMKARKVTGGDNEDTVLECWKRAVGHLSACADKEEESLCMGVLRRMAASIWGSGQEKGQRSEYIDVLRGSSQRWQQVLLSLHPDALELFAILLEKDTETVNTITPESLQKAMEKVKGAAQALSGEDILACSKLRERRSTRLILQAYLTSSHGRELEDTERLAMLEQVLTLWVVDESSDNLLLLNMIGDDDQGRLQTVVENVVARVEGAARWWSPGDYVVACRLLCMVMRVLDNEEERRAPMAEAAPRGLAAILMKMSQVGASKAIVTHASLDVLEWYIRKRWLWRPRSLEVGLVLNALANCFTVKDNEAHDAHLVMATTQGPIKTRVCNSLSLMLKFHSQALYKCTAPFMLLLEAVFRSLLCDDHHVLDTAKSLTRLYEQLARHRQALKRYMMYTVATYVTATASQTIPDQVRSTLLPGIYALMEALSSAEIQHMHTALLDASGQPLLKKLHSDYHVHHKYTGKV